MSVDMAVQCMRTIENNDENEKHYAMTSRPV